MVRHCFARRGNVEGVRAGGRQRQRTEVVAGFNADVNEELVHFFAPVWP